MSEYQGLGCTITRIDDCETTHIQKIGEPIDLLTGTYNLEIATTPPTIIKGVDINENEINDVILPSPGSLLLRCGGSGFGGIFTDEPGGGKLVKKFSDGNPSGRYILQPGKYKVVFRSRSAKQSVYTFEKEFTISPNGSINIDF
jgi:Ca-activated chloride channel family protein